MAISSDKKKLYVDATNNKGITPWEVAQCIGDYRITRLGRDIGMLCTSPKINMWAKFKPIRHSNIGVLVDEQRANANYGIQVPYGKWGDLFDESKTFTYLKPRGKNADYNEPFRLLDFNGYNHKATPIEIYKSQGTKFYAGVDTEVYVSIFASDEQEISFSDFSMKTGTQTSAPTLPLNQWTVMMLFKIGTSYYIYNTGKTLDEAENNSFFFTIDGSKMDVGESIKMIAVLAHNSTISEGFSTLSASSGDYNTTYFIPLNITDKLEGEMSATVIEWKVFDTFDVTYESLTLPQNLAPQYSFGSYFVFTTKPTNTKKLTYTFKTGIYIKRGEQIMQGVNGSSVRTDTITLEYNAPTGMYIYNLGNVKFNGITATQTGDELYLKVTCTSEPAGSPQNIVLWEEKIYTY